MNRLFKMLLAAGALIAISPAKEEELNEIAEREAESWPRKARYLGGKGRDHALGPDCTGVLFPLPGEIVEVWPDGPDFSTDEANCGWSFLREWLDFDDVEES